MNDDLTLSLTGERLIKRYAGYEIRPWQNRDGLWLCGWGHYGPDVPHDPYHQIEDDQALAWFEADTSRAMHIVRELVTQKLTQPQFDALTSFVFAEGGATLADSHLLTLINAADWAEAALYWERLGREDGAYLRRWEADLFSTPA